MKRALLYAFLFLTLLSCSKEEEEVLPSNDPVEREAAEQVTLIYFMGTSLNSWPYYYFGSNAEDAVLAVGDGALGKYGRFYYFMPSSSSAASLYEIIQNQDGSTTQRLVREFTSFASIDPDSMAEVIALVNDDVEWSSERQVMNLVMSSHGMGWLLDTSAAYSMRNATLMVSSSDGGGYGSIPMTRYMGTSSDGVINISELANGLANGGVKFGFILFDSCFMSSVEVLYRLRDRADYIIASPCEVMGYGFPFAKVLPQMFENSGRDYDLLGICEEYYNHYNDGCDPLGSISACVAVCVTSELESLAEVVKSTARGGVTSSSIQGYSYRDYYPFYDLNGYMYAACSTADYELFDQQMELTFPTRYRLHTDSFFVSNGSSYYFRDVDSDLYSGVTTSAPVSYSNWSSEPWAVATTYSN